MNKGNSGSSGSKSSDNKKSERGFAAMDPEKQREISKKGGEASGGGNRGRSKK